LQSFGLSPTDAYLSQSDVIRFSAAGAKTGVSEVDIGEEAAKDDVEAPVLTNKYHF
jgi:hypothetical protein